MFVRKKNNKSGSVSIQIIDKSNGKYKVLKTVGSSSNEDEIEKLYEEAYKTIPALEKQKTFNFLTFKLLQSYNREQIKNVFNHNKSYILYCFNIFNKFYFKWSYLYVLFNVKK